MPSGKQSKRRRRAGHPAVPPPVQRKGQRRRASPRVLAAGTALLVLILVAAILGFSFGRGGSSRPTTLSGAANVQTLLKGIPQKGNVLGKATAPATIVEYIDLQCPFCQQFETQALPSLIRQYVRTGTAKLVMRPIAFIGPDSQVGRLAAIAAGGQNKMFNFAQLLYLNQGSENSGWLDNNLISSAAGRVPGLNVSKLEAGRGTAATAKSAAAFDRQAVADAVQVTPTILVGQTGGKLQRVSLSSPSDAQSVGAAVNRLLG
jgi:protein-disulfide isomerase